MRRFIIPFPLPDAAQLVLDGDLYRHFITVLRLKPGNSVCLVTPSGETCDATIIAVGEGTVTLHLGQARQALVVSPLRIVLFQGIPKGDKLDLIIQKATELGVATIVPFPAERSVVKIPPERLPERCNRWNRIAAEAARQSGAAVPRVVPAASLSAALSTCDTDLRLLPWEDEQTANLQPVLAKSLPPLSVAIMIGPEGGFSSTEVATARERGFQTVRLGPRILRTETAGVTLVAILQHVWGDIH
jgi:16S rRNA (uracil1498-N3)-methyltransferase